MTIIQVHSVFRGGGGDKTLGHSYNDEKSNTKISELSKRKQNKIKLCQV